MRRRMRNTHSFKLRQYIARSVNLNEYLDLLPGANISEIFCVTGLNEIFLNSTSNIWSKQVYFQGNDCEYITFKSAVKMFELKEI